MNILIRPARQDEASEVTDLAIRSKAYWGYDAAFMEACRPVLTVHPATIAAGDAWIADHIGRKLGMYTLAHHADSIELDMLFVAPEAIGQGIGSALFRHAVIQARERGASRFITEADPNAADFYRAMGMRQYAERESTTQAGRLLPLMEISLMIYHLIVRADWEQTQGGTHYSASSLASEGFIHFSTLEQVAGSANRYYAGRNDMLLLEINPMMLTTPLIYEAPKNPDRAHERFPHLYAPLNLDAVVRVLTYMPDESGKFELPIV
jgi:uncharacterized protein (DUF952 family)/predicted GNAT family acetyltransferase